MRERESIYLETREKWREWLKKNGDSIPGIWLIYYKKHTGKPSIAYNDAVEEALCFGWIDRCQKTLLPGLDHGCKKGRNPETKNR